MSRMVVLALVLMALIAWGSAAEEFGWGDTIGSAQSHYDVDMTDENFTITHVDFDTYLPRVRTSLTRAYFDTLVPAERTSVTRAYFDTLVPAERTSVTQEYYDELGVHERTSQTQAYFDAFVSGRRNRVISGIF
jgi:hypothetical protein